MASDLRWRSWTPYTMRAVTSAAMRVAIAEAASMTAPRPILRYLRGRIGMAKSPWMKTSTRRQALQGGSRPFRLAATAARPAIPGRVAAGRLPSQRPAGPGPGFEGRGRRRGPRQDAYSTPPNGGRPLGVCRGAKATGHATRNLHALRVLGGPPRRNRSRRRLED